MRSLASALLAAGPSVYLTNWETVARAGIPHVALDAQAPGWRYLSLNALVLTRSEAASLRRLTVACGALLDRATAQLLQDRDAWSELAWPRPAIELASQEPPHPCGRSTLYGRFDWLLEQDGSWQLVEYNADTPSGGREATGFEPTALRILRRHEPGLSGLSAPLPRLIVDSIARRLAEGNPQVRRVGVVSSHSWLEDMAQAIWLTQLLQRAGLTALVGDVTDLERSGSRLLLRGEPIDALYRFYPFERLYRHALFASILELAIDRRLVLLNGLRGFLAQSKATLAWLWLHRHTLADADRQLVERHLPATLPARHADAAARVPESVVKHVNGREGDSVAFGETLDAAAWEARLIEPGYVVQRRVHPVPIEDVVLDERTGELRQVSTRYPCVGGFCIGGRFGGCYTRLDGPITTGKATYVPTLVEARGVPRQ